MTPQIIGRRPQGVRVLPSVAVTKRTVIDYQPSWLLLAIPTTLLALRARRKKSKTEDAAEQHSPAAGLDMAAQKQRWRRRKTR